MSSVLILRKERISTGEELTPARVNLAAPIPPAQRPQQPAAPSATQPAAQASAAKAPTPPAQAQKPAA
ncbi:hypothetical protein U1Q18_001036 [Sarracenia purpurea var. burkii]